MLSHVQAEAAQLNLPKVFHDFRASTNFRRRIDSSLYDGVPCLVSRPKMRTDSPTDTIDDDRPPSPLTPQGIGSQFVYHVSLGSSDSPDEPNPPGMYESLQKGPFSSSSNGYAQSAPAQIHLHGVMGPQKSFSCPATELHNEALRRDSSFLDSLPSESLPSVDNKSSSSLSYLVATNPQTSTATNGYSSAEVDHFHPLNSSLPDYFPRRLDSEPERPPHQHLTSIDYRPKSEPSISGPYSTSNGTPPSRSLAYEFPSISSSPAQSASVSYSHQPVHSEVNTGSLHEPQHQCDYSITQQWKQEEQTTQLDFFGTGEPFDDQSSPLVPPASDDSSGSQHFLQSPHFPSIASGRYDSSPPDTSTSPSSARACRAPGAHKGVQRAQAPSRGKDVHLVDSNGKTYAFVALAGNTVKKRPRRRYDEIERLYQCSWPGCTKGYGTLNHLNAHVTMQNHGLKRSPNEFKELRKQWRKARKEGQDNRSDAGWSVQRSDTDPGYNAYDRHHHTHQHRHPHSHHLGLHPSHSMPSLKARYTEAAAVPLGDLHYPSEEGFRLRPQEREFIRRTPFTPGSAPSSWQSSVMVSRSLPTHYPSNAPNDMLSYGTISDQFASAPDIPLSRLPQDSTLFTPLPGYDSSSLLPPLQADIRLGNRDGYHPYDRTYGDELRPKSRHVALGDRSADGDCMD